MDRKSSCNVRKSILRMFILEKSLQNNTTNIDLQFYGMNWTVGLKNSPLRFPISNSLALRGVIVAHHLNNV